jgi:glycosyltransferase involved in cell wall biosynthesis
MKKVSVIIPTYNSIHTIGETILSIKNQTYPALECIIIDDYSQDATLQVISELIDEKFQLIELESNKGGAYARNIGLSHAAGDLVMFVDSDDLLSCDSIERRVKYYEDKYDFLVFPNSTRFKNKIGDLNYEFISDSEIRNPLKHFIIHDLPLPWNIMSVLWKKDSLKILNGFDEDYTRMQDVEIIVRALIIELNYEVFYMDPDHHYRITVDKRVSKLKTSKFYDSSSIFIAKISMLSNDLENARKILVRKSLKNFFIKTYISLILSNGDPKYIHELTNISHNNGLLNERLIIYLSILKISVVQKIISLKGLRGIIWRIALIHSKS